MNELSLIGLNTESRPKLPADFYDVSFSVDAIITDHQQKTWSGTYTKFGNMPHVAAQIMYCLMSKNSFT